MNSKQKIYVHFQDSKVAGLEVVGVSSNPIIALDFVASGGDRSIKIFQLETTRRGKNGLVQKRGRKAGSSATSKNTKLPKKSRKSPTAKQS